MRKRMIVIVAMLVFDAVVLAVFLPLAFGTRELSQAELALAEPIYESSIDLEKVRIKSGGPLTLVYPGVAIGNIISFPKNGYDINDREDQALFIHELCHVWQFQHFGAGYIPRSLWELITQRDTYVVHYDAEKSLRDYDVEEQCEIAAEYFLTGGARYEPYIAEFREAGVE